MNFVARGTLNKLFIALDGKEQEMLQLFGDAETKEMQRNAGLEDAHAR